MLSYVDQLRAHVYTSSPYKCTHGLVGFSPGYKNKIVDIMMHYEEKVDVYQSKTLEIHLALCFRPSVNGKSSLDFIFIRVG